MPEALMSGYIRPVLGSRISLPQKHWPVTCNSEMEYADSQAK